MTDSDRQPWTAWPLAMRLKVIGRFRKALVDEALTVAQHIVSGTERPADEALVSEVLPLLDAAKFLEREAARILAPRHISRRGRPLWLLGTSAVVRRNPLGTVLIIAPSNYPLFLPGVQLLQALATGNVVRIKPAPGCSALLLRIADLLARSGLPKGILEILGDTVDDAQRAIDACPDKVVLTGAVETGRGVLSSLARSVIPATLELSGCDAAFVCEDADLDLAANALLFGLRLNHGATCIAPRRVFCVRRHLPAFAERIELGLSQLPAVNLPAARRAKVEALLDDAERQGAQVIIGQTVDRDRFSPVLVRNAVPSMALLQADVFAPVLSLVEVRDLDEALDGNRQCPYALGASIFAAPATAAKLADLIEVGVVTINDVIVPTADPRLPFGGRRASGFGVTRGREGLLDMTVPKVTIERRGRFRPHYAPPRDDDVDLYLAYIEAVHGAGMRRMTAFGRLVVRLALRTGIRRQ